MITTQSIIYKQIDDLKDIQEMVSFQEEIWSREAVIPLAQLIAASHHGGFISGAFHDGKLIGMSYSFPGYKHQEHYLYSHMAAVHQDYRNLGIGLQLKLKQREWAIQYGYKKIVWTFDPLEARNAYFNLNKLGAYVKTYIPSYYGEMKDKLNKGLPSDRFLAEWDICSTRVKSALAGSLQNEFTVKNYEPLLNYRENNQLPFSCEEKIINNEDGYLLPVPANIHHLKKVDIETAKAWRYELRKVLTEVLSKGYRVTGMLKNNTEPVHYYVIENKNLEHDHD
ncbi:GNAT family N-acetyltransferase [Bacillus aerolatus]|uniref:GNAT family N-acetyltransferase n=1 Tax=Bacillus aerolatus TaxID=2653354 RepID=A0A6I1FFB5_9BACI|nr:GNAT family N-acetyltransferase [Bacillus aerolatus]KAB7706707.1 GNAT family N-acetyltransferase [Bacillus aerolatus]